MGVGGMSQGYYGVPGVNQMLSPALMRAMMVNPMIRVMLSQMTSQFPPGTQQSAMMGSPTTQQILQWAANQGNMGRAIQPTIPVINLPQQVQQIIQQLGGPTGSNIGGIATGLVNSGLPTGTDVYNPKGNFQGALSTSGLASIPTSSAGGVSAAQPTNQIAQIVQKAVQDVLGGGGAGGGASTSGGLSNTPEKSSVGGSPSGSSGGTLGGSDVGSATEPGAGAGPSGSQPDIGTGGGFGGSDLGPGGGGYGGNI